MPELGYDPKQFSFAVVGIFVICWYQLSYIHYDYNQYGQETIYLNPFANYDPDKILQDNVLMLTNSFTTLQYHILRT